MTVTTVFLLLLHASLMQFPQQTGISFCLICGLPLLQDYSGQFHLILLCLAAQARFDQALPWQAVTVWLLLALFNAFIL
jgi:hypothetical protein